MKPDTHSPFNLKNTSAYQLWREFKLNNAKTNNNKRLVSLEKTPPHFYDVSAQQNSSEDFQSQPQIKTNQKKHIHFIDRILLECEIDNYCIYKIEDHEKYNSENTKQIVHTLARSCGLLRLDNNICADNDSLTSIRISKHKNQHEYIPYTNKKLSWHTDGYYNLPEHTINSMLLHCYTDAKSGGESAFLDHEIAYILLRDANPQWIEALSQPHVMTIPANVLNGKIIRPEQTGPVFSLSSSGKLHMRFSARQKNIIWKKDNETSAAIEFLNKLLNSIHSIESTSIAGSEFIIRHKLKAGEGIISRNIIHCRTAFHDNTIDSKKRLLFRGRFYDEISSKPIDLFQE